MSSLGFRPFRSVARAFLVLVLTLGPASIAAASAEDQDPATSSAPSASGLSSLNEDHLAGGASRLAALLLAHILPACSVVAPCQPGAALRDLVLVQRGQTTSQSGGRPDFLFGRPRGSLGIRGSWVFARAGSDLFDFVEKHLTVDRHDFNTPALTADVGIALTPRVDAVFGVDVSRVSIASEYRDLVDNNRKPITQDTRLREVNLAGSIRFSVTPRGRGISRYAWIPARAVPYVGAGGGALWYDFTQSGDFVDALAPAPQPIFTDVFDSKGWTPSAHAFGGVDIKLSRILFMTVEGRYLWASAKLGRDFQDFDPLDLAGFRLSAGVNVLF